MEMFSLLGICDEYRGGFSFHPAQIPKDPPSNGIRLYFATVSSAPVNRRQAIEVQLSRLAKFPVSWIEPSKRFWKIDLEGLTNQIEEVKRPPWLKGIVRLEPEFETGSVDLRPNGATYRGFLCFYITEEVVRDSSFSTEAPPELRESLRRFRSEYPIDVRTAFVMMRFGRTMTHRKIVQAIQKALRPHSIVALRADSKDYHEDLLSNVLTYIYGCTFGIAVFERIESDDFNPNVSLELGYVLALGKPVCILKEMTLRTLPTDLMGRLYRPFDAQSPGTSIPPQLTKWCEDRGFLAAQV
jgi:hypothetical protein